MVPRRTASRRFPFASSSTSLSRYRICRKSGSSIASTRTPQIVPVIWEAAGFSSAPAKKSAKVVPSARCRSSSTTMDQALVASSTFSENFADSVGVGSYRIDLHPSSGGDNYIDVSSLPFQIPLGALIPERVENLSPACKNLGTTHITNGCYRLHPVEWSIGEAVGELAAFCLTRKKAPRQVRKDAKLLADYQAQLVKAGSDLDWPEDIAKTVR